MCSRYSLTSPPEAVRAYFRHQNEHMFPPRYNIAPTQPVGVVRIDEAGNRVFSLVRWGLMPPWVKDPRTFATLINARAETAPEKPSFRGSFRHKRCLVPADGFYEWTGPVGGKRPHLIRPRDRSLMAFAGLFESWLGADGSEIDTMGPSQPTPRSAPCTTACRQFCHRPSSTNGSIAGTSMSGKLMPFCNRRQPTCWRSSRSIRSSTIHATKALNCNSRLGNPDCFRRY